MARKDREKRNIEEELKDRAEEATRDREAIRELKVSLRPGLNWEYEKGAEI